MYTTAVPLPASMSPTWCPYVAPAGPYPVRPTWCLNLAASSQRTSDPMIPCIVRNLNSCQASCCKYRKSHPQTNAFLLRGTACHNQTLLCFEAFATGIAQALLTQSTARQARGWREVGCASSVVCTPCPVTNQHITYQRYFLKSILYF